MNQEDVTLTLGFGQLYTKFHEERMKTCGDMLLTYSNIGY